MQYCMLPPVKLHGTHTLLTPSAQTLGASLNNISKLNYLKLKKYN